MNLPKMMRIINFSIFKQNNESLPKNMFDEKPITFKATNFNELLEEQAQKNNNKEFINEEKKNIKKTTYLKKGRRPFLLSGRKLNDKKETLKNIKKKNMSSKKEFCLLKRSLII